MSLRNLPKLVSCGFSSVTISILVITTFGYCVTIDTKETSEYAKRNFKLNQLLH